MVVLHIAKQLPAAIPLGAVIFLICYPSVQLLFICSAAVYLCNFYLSVLLLSNVQLLSICAFAICLCSCYTYICTAAVYPCRWLLFICAAVVNLFGCYLSVHLLSVCAAAFHLYSYCLFGQLLSLPAAAMYVYLDSWNKCAILREGFSSCLDSLE